MLFNSLHFVLFFIVMTTSYFLINHKYRWALLLTGSCYFYMVFMPIYILILAFTIIVDYFAGIYIEKFESKKKKLFLIGSLVANIGVLGLFKYYNFMIENISGFLTEIGYSHQLPNLSLLLPIGLSFHTFQAMSYTIEVYKGRQKAERHFGIYALYVLFFPQLVAGPIERPQNMLHQFMEVKNFDYHRVVSGMKIILMGIFKKVVIADRLALYVNAVYNNQSYHNGKTLILATFFFALQIYCDFSAYSEIALGSARILGFKLMVNFRRPYFAVSIREFWNRWHISLSTWFRDYLYIPLGGNRNGKIKWCINIFIVFLVSGLWHGAGWTYILWGALHGFYIMMSIVLKPLTTFIKDKTVKMHDYLGIIVTFILSCFAWIFFRANSIHDAFDIIEKLFSKWDGHLYIGDPAIFVYCLIAVSILLVMEFKQEFLPQSKLSLLYHSNLYVRFTGYALIVLMILSLGVLNGAGFIYFQF